MTHVLGTYDINNIIEALAVAADQREAEIADDDEMDADNVERAKDMRALADLFYRVKCVSLELKE